MHSTALYENGRSTRWHYFFTRNATNIRRSTVLSHELSTLLPQQPITWPASPDHNFTVVCRPPHQVPKPVRDPVWPNAFPLLAASLRQSATMAIFRRMLAG